MIIIIWEDRRQDFPKVTRVKSVENESGKARMRMTEWMKVDWEHLNAKEKQRVDLYAYTNAHRARIKGHQESRNTLISVFAV